MKKKSIISLCLAFCLVSSVGCDQAVDAVEEAKIELFEPKATLAEVTQATEAVMRRNIYDAEVYATNVYPSVTEYSYSMAQTREEFAVKLGDTVKRGTVLAYADTVSIDAKIQNQEEYLNNLTEQYEESRKELEAKIAEQTDELEYLEEVLGGLGELDHVSKWQGQYKHLELELNMNRQKLLEKKEVYELDYAYYMGLLEQLKKQRAETTLISKTEGEVVALNYNNASLEPDEPVVAVGDMNVKLIKVEGMTKRQLEATKELYAFVNGKRYEITYDEAESELYNTFRIQDDNNEVSVGDVASLVCIKDIRENVLTVPAEAVWNRGAMRFVYVYENGETSEREIETGMSNGICTEVVSGLEEGEEIVISRARSMGSNTVVLEKGTFDTSFSTGASVFYVESFHQQNSLEKVTAHFGEYLVIRYENVEVGDPIATVSVEGNEVELLRLETELKRQRERLADLIAEGNDANEESIERKQESIAELEAEIAQWERELSTTTIYAEHAGTVTSTYYFANNDELNQHSGIAVICDASSGYIEVEAGKGYLNYGDEISVYYTAQNGMQEKTTGRIVTMGDLGTSKGLVSDTIYVRLPDGVVENVAEYAVTGEYYRKNKLSVYSPSVREMEDVVLVPAEAVTESNGVTYVNVISEDGRVVPVSFIAGGFDKEFYWVIDGLEEGMTVCW